MSEKRYCYDCGKEIIFTNAHRSTKGIAIPCDPDTQSPHVCEKKPQFQQGQQQNLQQEDPTRQAPLPRPQTNQPLFVSRMKIFTGSNLVDVERHYNDFVAMVETLGAVGLGTTMTTPASGGIVFAYHYRINIAHVKGIETN